MLDGSTYRPADPDESGRSCLIVPSTEDGVLIDLVAMDLADRRLASRLGLAAVIGDDAVEAARENGWPLFVFDDVLTWLRGGSRGAVVVDWHRAAAALDGVSTIASSRQLAKQMHGATAQCWPRPNIYIAAKVPHAA
jgi:hypothetical protein